MVIAVIPAKNEAQKLPGVLTTLGKAKVDRAVVVLNGCTDHSLIETLASNPWFPAREVLWFSEALGLDVPRAIGAWQALQHQATAILFIDGDMDGVPVQVVRQLLAAIQQGIDLALTDCYPGPSTRTPANSRVIDARLNLNRSLHLDDRIGFASPSHGPHAISARLMAILNPADLSVPPLLLLRAVQHHYLVALVTAMPHEQLGSPQRSLTHSRLIAETIIGDCREAWFQITQQTLTSRQSANFPGYDPYRRRDILQHLLLDKRSLQIIQVPRK